MILGGGSLPPDISVSPENGSVTRNNPDYVGEFSNKSQTMFFDACTDHDPLFSGPIYQSALRSEGVGEVPTR